MDNLTHSLVGLFLARAGFKRLTPRGTGIMVLAANIPDFDAVSWFGGGATYIHYHRNLTHSLLGIPVMAALAIVLVRILGGSKIRWLPAWCAAMVAVASHVILDLTNTYGVRLLLPFSGRWFHWDLTPIIDLAIWTVLLLCLAAPALARLVGSEIGERRQASSGAGWAVVGLLLLCGYDYGRSVLHDRAVSEMDSRTFNGLAPRRVGAFPSGNPLVWRGAAELSNAYVEVPIDLRSSFHSSDQETWYKAPRTPAVNAALQTFPFQRLLEFVQWPLWVVEPAADLEKGSRVTLIDLRFGTPREDSFASTATVDERNHVLDAHFGFGRFRPR
ncbi:MAG TPA: metal-dependent hydrolase [Bryobacteraceae bacterium]|nr:metal-dependent hydrolase [Bryobacteraceae bacterium]